MQVRCLHCHEPMAVSQECDFSSLTCPSCGSNFSLVGDHTVSHKSAQVRTLGHFDLIDRVGMGAFGSVWKAHDTELERTVAVKIPRKGDLDPEELEQFLREARAAAQLQHPNIVGVHEVGREGNSVYIVSDFVEGATLDDWLTGRRLSAREAAELCAKIADALHHAHEAGVIHRDLKPGNIMLDLQGEPHLMDFGLARRTAGEMTMTVDGRILGTPAYMSPEQARGEAHYADHRTDVYSAGVILFRLLTGELPFRGNPQMLVVQIQREEPPGPRKLNGRVPRDLETICLKCLEKNPERRYETAAELAAELRRWLSGEPIRARPISAPARIWRWSRRNPVIAGLTATATLLLMAVAVVASVGYVRVRGALGRESAALGVATTERDAAREARDREAEQRAAAEQQRQKAIASEQTAKEQREKAERSRASEQAAKEQLRRQLYVSDMNLTARAYADGSIDRMNELLEKHRPRPGADEEDLRGFEWYLWWRAGHLHQARNRSPTLGPIYRLAVSPDGKTVAAPTYPPAILLYDTARVRIPRSPLATMATFATLSFSPDGAWLASGGRESRIHVWSTADWSQRRSLLTTSGPASDEETVSIAFSPAQPILASGGRGSPITFWNTSSWERLATVIPDGIVRGLAFAADGTLLVAGMEDGTLVVCDVEARTITHTIPAHEQPITSLVRWPDGSRLATGSDDETIRLWNSSLEPIETLPARAPVKSLAVSGDGRLLAAGTSGNNSVLVWNAESPRATLTAAIKGHSREVVGVAFAQDTLWSASDDGLIKTWDVLQCEPFDTVGNVSPDTRLAYSRDGRMLLFQDSQGAIGRWDIAARELLAPLHGGEAYSHFAVSDDGAVIAATRDDGRVSVWDVTDGRLLFQQPLKLDQSHYLAVSRDGRHVAATSLADRSILICDMQRGSTSRIPPDVDTANWPAFSPDGRYLAVHSNYAIFTTQLWDISADPPAQRYVVSGWGPENCAAFSPDGTTLAIGSYNNDIRVYEVASGQTKYSLKGHGGEVLTLAFSGDGRRLVSGSADGTTRIWTIRPDEGRLAATLPGQSGRINSVAFSPGGDSVASLAGDGSLRIWRAASPHEAERDVDQLIDRAVDYYIEQGMERALEEMTAALERFPGNEEARGITAEYHKIRSEQHVRQGMWSEAVANMTRALELNPDTVDAMAHMMELIGSRALIPTSDAEPVSWRYTFSQPAEGWQNRDFDDTQWKSGHAPFATWGPSNTLWPPGNDEIWLRREFLHDESSDAPLLFHAFLHDRTEIYVNGARAASGAWVMAHYAMEYQRLPGDPRASLRPGENVLAVHCRKFNEQGRLDVGLFQLDPSVQDTILDILGKALETHPEHHALLETRSQEYLRRAMWSEAAADLTKIAALDPGDSIQWLKVAPPLILAGDRQAYRRHIQNMAAHFVDSDALTVDDQITKASLLLPDTIPVFQPHLAKLSRALDDGTAPDWFQPWGLAARALAACRAGDAEQALRWVPKTEETQGPPPCRALCLVIQAIAQYQRGNLPEAREAHRQAAELIDLNLRQLKRDGTPNDWHDWLIAEVLRREVDALVDGRSPARTPED